MKRILLLLVIISAIGCTKEKNPSLIGRWNITESVNDVGQKVYNNSRHTYVKFNSDGSFEMDTVKNYFAYKGFLQNMSRYRVVSNEKIMFCSSDSKDSAWVSYSLDKELILGFHYVVETFSK